MIGLDEADHYPSQRLNYHITDVGSLGNSTKPFASFEILNEAGGRGSIGGISETSTNGEVSKQSAKKKIRSDGGAEISSSNHMNESQVGEWSVKTLYFKQPLTVEAIITTK